MLVETSRDQVFQISPTVRVVAEYEQDYETIDEVAKNVGIGIQTLRVPNNFYSYSTSDEYSDDIQAIIGMGQYNYEFDKVEPKVSEFLTAQGIPFIITCLKGFSQGEWHDVVVYDVTKTWTVEQLEGQAQEFDSLFAGEVYRVNVEHATVFTSPNGDTRTEWTIDESFETIQVVEKLFTLNADFVSVHYNLEVVIEG